MGIAVQAVDEDYVYSGRVGSFELRQAISIHVWLHGGLEVCLAKGTNSATATMTYHGRDQLKYAFDGRTRQLCHTHIYVGASWTVYVLWAKSKGRIALWPLKVRGRCWYSFSLPIRICK